MDLLHWQHRLEEHFKTLHEQRSEFEDSHPIFALEHDLNESEIHDLNNSVRTHVKDRVPSWEHRLPWTIYASEIGYLYSGDQYWQTFEESTPGWLEHGDRNWIRRCFQDFQRNYGGAKPTGAWARHFSIIILVPYN